MPAVTAFRKGFLIPLIKTNPSQSFPLAFQDSPCDNARSRPLDTPQKNPSHIALEKALE